MKQVKEERSVLKKCATLSAVVNLTDYFSDESSHYMLVEQPKEDIR